MIRFGLGRLNRRWLGLEYSPIYPWEKLAFFRVVRRVWGRRVYVIGTRLKPSAQGDDDFLILVTNHLRDQALSDYARRWGIETLFGALKTRGFCLESTHFTDAERLSKLLAMLAIAFAWAMKTGLWQHSLKPIPLKPHRRRAKSLFRLGFDYQFSIFTNLDHQFHAFTDSLHFLPCT